MSEQQSETTTTEKVFCRCPHPEAVGERWGDPLSPERQLELQELLDQWKAETDHRERTGAFDRTGLGDRERQRCRLTGADVYWLAEKSGRNEYGRVPDLHLEGAWLNMTHLEDAKLDGAHLEGAVLVADHLEGASLWYAHMEGADLGSSHLEDARLNSAHLKGARFQFSNLEGAELQEAELEGADFSYAHLEGASLDRAHLEGARLTSASFDKGSRLNDAIFTGARFDQVIFDNTNLTVVDWSDVDILGDETKARKAKYDIEDAKYGDKKGDLKPPATRLAEYKAAVRANRLLAVTLRNQGMNEDADHFAYRAQLLQQQVLRGQRKFGGYLFSRLLDGLAGYGYMPVRGLIAYIIVILGSAFAYGLATDGIITFGLPRSSIQPLQWYETLVLSISSFHGRGFFQPVQSLGDPVAIIAAAEAIIGLLIEISFIATFTQRFFGR